MPRFVLTRILGNDLPPRHRSGQTEANLRFILEREAPLERCEKRWIVNRVVDPAAEARLLDLLRQHGARVSRVPWCADAYRRIGRTLEDFESPAFLSSDAFRGLPAGLQARAIDHSYHHKNLYVMNNNGARNRALAEARDAADWILPLDGACFFTPDGWARLLDAARRAPRARYLVIPMARVPDNRDLDRADLARVDWDDSWDEPQLGFHRDARERFDERLRYGRRSKAELLARLGVEHWSTAWRRHAWESSPPASGPPPPGHVVEAGWVLRLASGRPEQDRSGPAALEARTRARMEGVRRLLARLDAGLGAQRLR